MKRFLFKAIISSAACHLFAACATRPTFMPGDDAIRNHLRGKKSVSVLFIGNSLSFGLPIELEKICQENGIKINATLQAQSGWTLERHSKDAKTLEVLRGKPWDIVVIQEQSRIPSQPVKRYTQMVAAVMQITREARATGAMPVLYQTWGYRYGDKRRSNDDFFAMNQRLRKGYDVSARIGGLSVVRVGDAWESEMTNGRGDRLFLPDGLHPSNDGVRLNAQVFYETLFAHHAAPKNRKMRLNVSKPTRGGG
jgi:lysophospholipase L1-like esterase